MHVYVYVSEWHYLIGRCGSMHPRKYCEIKSPDIPSRLILSQTTTRIISFSGFWLLATLHYHDCTSLYLTLHYSIMALLDSIQLYITSPWLYFTLLDITLPYNGFTLLCIILPWLYFSLPCLCIILIDSTLLYHLSTSFYLTLHFSTMILLHST